MKKIVNICIDIMINLKLKLKLKDQILKVLAGRTWSWGDQFVSGEISGFQSSRVPELIPPMFVPRQFPSRDALISALMYMDGSLVCKYQYASQYIASF